MNRILKLVVFSVVLPMLSFCQKKGMMLNGYISVGVSGQTDVLDKFGEPYGYNGIYSNILPGNGANDEGIGVPIKFQLYSSKVGLGLNYEPILRHAIVTPGSAFWVAGKGNLPAVYKFFADQHFSFYHNFRFPRILRILPDWLRVNKSDRNYFGIGFSMMAPGLSYEYDYYIEDFNSGKVETGTRVDISFNGVHLYLGFPIYKNIFFEAKVLHVPEGQRMFEQYHSKNLGFAKFYYRFKVM